MLPGRTADAVETAMSEGSSPGYSRGRGAYY